MRLVSHIAKQVLGLFVAVVFLVISSEASACDHYAAPDGSGDAMGGPLGVALAPGTEAQPMLVSDFWNQGLAIAGATLCLKNGIYRGADSMIAPPLSTDGALGAPITVRAQNDGEAFIDGDDLYIPVHIRSSSHWLLEGFNAGNGSTTVIGISGEANNPAHRDSGITIRRVVAWDALISNGSSNNFHVWGISYMDDALLEDVGGFGTGRKIFQIYQSRRVTLRRAFARWEGSGGGSAIPISCLYRSYDVTCENNIALWTAEQQPSINVTSSGRGALAVDWLTTADESWADDGSTPNFDPKNADLRLLGNISIVPATVPNNPGVAPAAPLIPSGSIWLAYMKGIEFIDNLAIANRDDMQVWRILGCQDNVPAGADCDWAIGQDETEAPLVARHNTSWGGNGISTFGGWTVNEDKLIVDYGDPAPNVFTGTQGAQVCHRYEDGVLQDGSGATTTQPLWPWPMNERILAATTLAAGHSAEDVTQRIETLLGPIPSECRAAAVPAMNGPGIALLIASLIAAAWLLTAKSPRSRTS